MSSDSVNSRYSTWNFSHISYTSLPQLGLVPSHDNLNFFWKQIFASLIMTTQGPHQVKYISLYIQAPGQIGHASLLSWFDAEWECLGNRLNSHAHYQIEFPGCLPGALRCLFERIFPGFDRPKTQLSMENRSKIMSASSLTIINN
jgi:hypothetical protein